MVAVGGLVLTLFPPTAPIGAATLISSSIVGAPGAAYGTGNSLSGQRNILKLTQNMTTDCSISLMFSTCYFK